MIETIAALCGLAILVAFASVLVAGGVYAIVIIGKEIRKELNK